MVRNFKKCTKVYFYIHVSVWIRNVFLPRKNKGVKLEACNRYIDSIIYLMYCSMALLWDVKQYCNAICIEMCFYSYNSVFQVENWLLRLNYLMSTCLNVFICENLLQKATVSHTPIWHTTLIQECSVLTWRALTLLDGCLDILSGYATFLL